MPAVYVDLVLRGERRVELKGLLNSGAEDIELVVPASVARELGCKSRGKSEIAFGGRRYSADTLEVDVEVRNPGGEARRARLRCLSLPDRLIDCVILGTDAQAELGVIPDTVAGKPIFK